MSQSEVIVARCHEAGSDNYADCMKHHTLKESVLAYSPKSSNFVGTFTEAFMRTTIRKVGNSRGIIIPAAFIATCGFGDEVELSVDGAKLVIEAAQAHRRGWVLGYDPNNDVEVLAALPLDDLGEEWSW